MLLCLCVSYLAWPMFWPQLPSRLDNIRRLMKRPYVYTVCFTIDRLMLRHSMLKWLLVPAHALVAVAVALSASRHGGANPWPGDPPRDPLPWSNLQAGWLAQWCPWLSHFPFLYWLLSLQLWATVLPWILADFCFPKLAAYASKRALPPHTPTAPAVPAAPASGTGTAPAPSEHASDKEGAAATTAAVLQPQETLKLSKPTVRPAPRHSLYIKVRTRDDAVGPHIPGHVALQMQRIGFKPINVATRPGCIVMRVDMLNPEQACIRPVEGPDTYDDGDQLLRIADAVLPLLHSMFTEEDARDSKRVDFVFGHHAVTARWDDGDMAWHLQHRPHVQPSMTLGFVSQLAFSGSTNASTHARSHASSTYNQVHLARMNVQLLPAAGIEQLTAEQVASVSGWMAPHPGQHGTAKGIQLLVSTGNQYMETRVLEVSSFSATHAAVKLELVVPDLLLARHHDGGCPVNLMPVLVELIQDESVWSSATLLLDFGAHMNPEASSTASWWWGTTGAMAERAARQLQRTVREGTVQLADWHQLQDGLFVWLISMQKLAVHNGHCTAQAPDAIAEVAWVQHDMSALESTGQQLKQALLRINMRDVARMVQQQLQAMLAWHHTPNAQQPVGTSYNSARVIIARFMAGRCWQCQLQTQGKARYWWATSVQAPLSLLVTVLGLATVLQNLHKPDDSLPWLMALPWAAHVLLCLQWLLGKPKIGQTGQAAFCSGCALLCTIIYIARMAVQCYLVWHGQQHDLEMLPVAVQGYLLWGGQQHGSRLLSPHASSYAMCWLKLVLVSSADQVNLLLNLAPLWSWLLCFTNALMLSFLLSRWGGVLGAVISGVSAALVPWLVACVCQHQQYKYMVVQPSQSGPSNASTASYSSVRHASGSDTPQVIASSQVLGGRQVQGQGSEYTSSMRCWTWPAIWRAVVPLLIFLDLFFCTTDAFGLSVAFNTVCMAFTSFLIRLQTMAPTWFGAPASDARFFALCTSIHMSLADVVAIMAAIFSPETQSVHEGWLKPLQYPYVYTVWFIADRMILRCGLPPWHAAVAHSLGGWAFSCTANKLHLRVWPLSRTAPFLVQAVNLQIWSVLLPHLGAECLLPLLAGTGQPRSPRTNSQPAASEAAPGSVKRHHKAE